MIVKIIVGCADLLLICLFTSWLRQRRQKMRLRREIIKIIFNAGGRLDKEKIAQALVAQNIAVPKDLMLFLWMMSMDGLLKENQKEKECVFSLTDEGEKLLPKQRKETAAETEIFLARGVKSKKHENGG